MSLLIRQFHTNVLRNGAKNHYQVLGVPSNASSKKIKAAFIKVVKRHHPDVNRLARKLNDISFADINEAYSVLSNPVRRREYDLGIYQGHSIHQRPNYSRAPEHYDKNQFYGPQQSMYHSSPQHRKYSNATVAGFLLIFVIFSGAVQFLRFSIFRKSQRAATERSQRNYLFYIETRERERRNGFRKSI